MHKNRVIMAEFRKMFPLIFHFAAGVYGKNGEDLLLPAEEQFELARRKGWSDDPDDPGGATMIDVTLATYSAYRRKKGVAVTSKSDLRNIPFGEWSEILKTMFWDKWRADEIRSQGMAHLLVDWVWASGPKTIRNAQRVIGVTADGIVGPKTLAAVNSGFAASGSKIDGGDAASGYGDAASGDGDMLFGRLYSAREDYCRGCRGAWKYLNGWLRRLSAIRPDGTFLINNRIF